MTMQNSRGFTLIELLIVVAITGIIAAIAIPNMLNAIDRGKQKRTMADIRALGTTIEAYSVDHSFYPNVVTTAALEPHVTPQYIRTTPSMDAWGWTFIINSAPLGFTLGSGGKDGGALTTVGGGGETSNFNDAIVQVNGQFTQWPDGLQQ